MLCEEVLKKDNFIVVLIDGFIFETNLKQREMKKVLLCAVLVFSVFTAYQVNTIETAVDCIDLASVEAVAASESGGTQCKWAKQTCDNGNTREVCVTDGNGGSCSCGSVTRPC